MEEKIKKIMSDILAVDIKMIDENASLHSIEEWDSFRHIELILALEQAFGIKFDDEEIPTMVSFQLIADTIDSYLD